MDDPKVKDILDLINQIKSVANDALSRFLYREGIDLNPAQAILITNIPDDGVVVGKLKTFGAFYGTNATYNVKLLEREGYIKLSSPRLDRRMKVAGRTAKGTAVRQKVLGWYEFYDLAFEVDEVRLGDTITTLGILKRTLGG